MSDNTLMTKVKRGEIEYLGPIFERYHHRLFAFFYRLTQRRDVSEDLVQAVFERILKYRESFNDEGVFSSWIFGIARNLHFDYQRKQSKESLSLDETDWNLLPDDRSEINSEQERDQWLVRKALNRLDPDKKQVLILSRYEGMRYKEIAEIMNCSESAVKVRVFRALDDMKVLITSMRNKEKL